MTETQDAGKQTPIELAADTLLGDVRDRMLRLFRAQGQPWAKMSESHQRWFNQDVEQIARELVKQATAIIATREFPVVTVTVGDLNTKGELVLSKLTAERTNENILALANAGRCSLVLADPGVFMGERAPAEVLKDQPDLMDKQSEAAQPEAEYEQQEVEGEADALSPEMQEQLRRNGDLVSSGIKVLEDPTVGLESEGLEVCDAETTANGEEVKPKRKRRTVEERVAERGRSVGAKDALADAS